MLAHGSILALPFADAAPPAATATAATSAEPFFHNYSAIAGVSANDSILNAAKAVKELNAGFLNGGRGACWIDYDGDGDDDLYVVGPGKNQLFRHDGGWSFADITDSSGLGDSGYGMACASADLDRDGDQDVWATNYDSYQSIFKNNGDGTFTNVTLSAIPEDVRAHTGVAFGDFDEDGLLDVFVTNYNRQQDRLYRNLGNMTFEERWNSSGVLDLDFGFQPLIFDYDLDGDVDVYAINDFGLDRLWRNDGNWSFADVTSQTGAGDPRGGMGGDVSDVDRDGDLDFFVGNYQENGLWVRSGSVFEDRAGPAGVDNLSTAWATVFFDYDNDGWEDLYVVNGVVDAPSERHQANILYRNLGNLTFIDVSPGSGAESAEIGRGAALADVDGDGRVDIYATNVNCPNELLRNVYNSTNAWVKIRLEGTVSNPDGVGAVVRVTAGNMTSTKPMMVGTGYLSSHSKVMHFGLGSASSIASVEIEWPSGLKQTVLSVPLNTTFTVREEDTVQPVAVASDVSTQQGLAFELNGSLSWDNVGIASYAWTVDENGSLRTAQGPLAPMTLYTPGVFTGSLEVRDDFGQANTTWFSVSVAPYDAAWVDAGPDFAVAEKVPHTFSVRGGSSLTPDFENTSTFVWTFVEAGVARVLGGPRPTYTFTQVGSLEVRVQVTDIGNNSAEDFVNVTVVDVTPPSIFAVVPASVDEDVPVRLDATGTADNDPLFPAGAAFVWSYEGSLGPVVVAGANTTHAFADPGEVRLTLTVSDAAGNSMSQAFQLSIADRTPPTPNAGADVFSDPGAEVTLSAAASTDNGPDFFTNGSFTWRVHFRSGPVELVGFTRVVSFADPGVFRVELFARDASGNAAAAPDELLVTVADTVPPLPDAGGDRSIGIGERFVLDASNSTDNDPDFFVTGVFIWEFQDGAARQRLFGQTVEYVFERAGEYRVRLSAYDAAGNSAAIIFTVTVGDTEAPTIVVGPMPSETLAGDALVLNASGTSDNVGVASIAWRVTGPFAFDKGVFGATGELVLPLPGTYNVTVTAQDAAGNRAQLSFDVLVVPRPSPGNGTGNGSNTTPPPGGGAPPPSSGGGAPTEQGALLPVAALLLGAGAGAGGALVVHRRKRGGRGEPPQAG